MSLNTSGDVWWLQICPGLPQNQRAMGLECVLEGIRIIDLSTALPGPLAASRLSQMGASVQKIEPPLGDLFEEVCPDWYSEINGSKKIRKIDLKTESGHAELVAELASTDLVLSSMRAAALSRLHLSPEEIRSRFPRLCWTAIVADFPPRTDSSGHDLNFQAAAGLLEPPLLPRFLLADLMGVERAIQAALGQILQLQKTGEGSWEWVSLCESARAFQAVLASGLTDSGRLLGGGSPRYGIYRARDGWLTLAVLETRLWQQFVNVISRPDLLLVDDQTLRTALTEIFQSQPVGHWRQLALQFRLPLAVVASPPASVAVLESGQSG